MFYYFNMFFIGSVLGFIMEFLLKTFIFHSMNSSILFGPWIPVYGFACCVIIFIERLVFNKLKLDFFWKRLVMFFFITIILTAIEFLGGVFIEKVFEKVFWDYSDMLFNFGKYVSLEISLIWCLLSVIFIYFIKPLIDKFINKIPRYFTILVLFLIIIDFVITISFEFL